MLFKADIVPGAVRVVGPYNLTFDQADLPGISQLYTFTNNVGAYPFVGAGTYRLFNGRVVTDAVIDVDGVTLTSATAAFTAADAGKPVGDGALVFGTTSIASVTNATTVVLADAEPAGPLTFLVIGDDSVQLDYADDRDAIQAALETLYGVANIECFVSDAAAFDEQPDVLVILFRGALGSQLAGLIAANDTGAEGLRVNADVLGDPTPRLGRILFTPTVGDQILDLFFDFNTAFSNPGVDAIYLWFGDLTGVDPMNLQWSGIASRKTLGSLFGGGFDNLAMGSPIFAVPGAPFTVRAKADAESMSADYAQPWGARARVREAVPLAVALGGNTSGGDPPTQGDVDIYIVVVTPTLT